MGEVQPNQGDRVVGTRDLSLEAPEVLSNMGQLSVAAAQVEDGRLTLAERVSKGPINQARRSTLPSNNWKLYQRGVARSKRAVSVACGINEN